MAQLSATEAALTGFRIIKAKPLVLVAWSLLMLIFVAAVFGLMFVGGKGLMSLGEDPTPEAALASLSSLAPLFTFLFIGGLLFGGIMSAAVNRAVLRPDASAFGYLRLGVDELLQIVVQIAYALLVVAGVVVVALVMSMTGSSLSGAAGGLTIFAVILAVIGGSIYLAVRLSLASAQTFDQRRINLFGSWSLTHGRFWPILGAYLLAFVLTIVVAIVGGVVISIVSMMVGGGPMDLMTAAASGGSTPEEVAAMFTPAAFLTVGMLVYLVLNCIMQAVSLALMRTPPADVYRQLSAPDNAAENF